AASTPAAAAGKPGKLAKTGSDTEGLWALVGLLLVGGAATTVIARRRSGQPQE
ncbi:LPXTG cell wall anchor domain-containing protein, partial [Actinomyces sp.]|uniref:LPXTG cell wall anchor domain-containing protein n=1 Tax=Actinomyces sp. TaxID=29317 RepID=UPI0037C09623